MSKSTGLGFKSEGGRSTVIALDFSTRQRRCRKRSWCIYDFSSGSRSATQSKVGTLADILLVTPLYQARISGVHFELLRGGSRDNQSSVVSSTISRHFLDTRRKGNGEGNFMCRTAEYCRIIVNISGGRTSICLLPIYVNPVVVPKSATGELDKDEP